MSAALKFTDQRTEPRIETFLKGQISLNGAVIARCTIRNISSMGALLTSASIGDVPDKFKLLIPDEMFETLCEVRHRSADSIGVLFTSGRRQALARFGSPYKD